MGKQLEWSDERRAEDIVHEFIRRELLSEAEAEAAAARLADDEPLQALRKALEHA